ncbi:MAG: hypothetical protein R3279_02320 [Putridiphycobacter sp.]|nr:hypothetical protein [Putridiphycobacter sp.]
MTALFDILIASTESAKEHVILYRNTNNHEPDLIKEVLKRDFQELLTHINRIENNFIRALSSEKLTLLSQMHLKVLFSDGLLEFEDLLNLFKNHQIYENMYPN